MFASILSQPPWTLTHLIEGLNIVGAAGAAWLNFMAALRGPRDWRWVRVAAIPAALAYVALYTALLFDLVPLATWSAIGRGMSVPTWIIIWWIPPLFNRRWYGKIQKAVAEQVAERKDAE